MKTHDLTEWHQWDINSPTPQSPAGVLLYQSKSEAVEKHPFPLKIFFLFAAS